ncbi:hypothetical protein Plhal304r1_c008g0031821 [Plasmopara halstedii]
MMSSASKKSLTLFSASGYSLDKYLVAICTLQKLCKFLLLEEAVIQSKQ